MKTLIHIKPEAMSGNCKGFSLIELIVVIALIGILLAIGSINFSTWQNKFRIENQAKELVIDLNDLRMRAIQSKSNHVAVLSTNPYSLVFRKYSSEEPVTLTTGQAVFTKTFKYPLSKSPTVTSACGDIGVTSRGYTLDFISGGTFSSNQTIYILPTLSGAASDCLIVSDTHVNLGRYNGTGCVYQ